ncbi:flagellar biogenesis protein [Novosphingobium barchaimii LL02]|uniref:Flagellar biogenesis protein n=1 Tax=Novosphingobium barchaimii LL02 TaxID=1114963 RepID=A0A0J8ABY7_9SPHN|nr:flagellar biosynthetic protein FliO [Novosphingobium barchaimii]KMS52660.1 flagellar biogenesis protein [Novosphingobium barchaimii LL02]
MDAWQLLRTLGALSVVLGALWGALWAVRRFDLTVDGKGLGKWLEKFGNAGPERRLKVVERLSIDQRRSVVLLRRDDTEFSLMIGPEGVVVLDTARAPAAPALAAPKQEEATFASRVPALPEVGFAQGDIPDPAPSRFGLKAAAALHRFARTTEITPDV